MVKIQSSPHPCPAPAIFKQHTVDTRQCVTGDTIMGKEHRSSREAKKEPAMTAKEKKAAKKARKAVKNTSVGILS